MSTSRAHGCVFANADLVSSIVAFQSGFPVTFLPFVKFMASHPRPNSLLEFTMTENAPFFQRELDDLTRLFASYFTSPDALPRLPRLFDYVPAMAHKALCFAIATGHLEMLRFLLHQPGYAKPYHGVAGIAAFNGRLEVLQFLVKHEWAAFTGQTLHWASRQGHLHVVQFLHPHVPTCLPVVMDAAARFGHLDIVTFLHVHRTEGCSTEAMDEAASAGRLDIVRFLHAHRTEGCTTRAMNFAAAHGHLDVVQYLHEHRGEGCTTMAMTLAGCYGHLEVVKFLHHHRTEGCTPRAWEGAVEHKHADVAAFLMANRIEVQQARRDNVLWHWNRVLQ
ncbi:Aste57867_20362 [Aphanomyces stellatus]|uniref:Aste57867_20362 protein n=1 Tax=Aphanomyces stellatus TaxID=120398 RepID=A0A485LG10_9STRA|nr:hypothetical protein As57867_020296 [Aphanomyces stellatus]VFT97049.1 Aste57867_20362 [Aphanomyces stellatus]